jgi:hypothetical protein
MTVLKFELKGEPDREAVEADVTLALFASECVYGRPRIRLETGYLVDDDGGACVISISGEAGEVAARVFAGLTAARLGESAFSVRRIEEAAT